MTKKNGPGFDGISHRGWATPAIVLTCFLLSCELEPSSDALSESELIGYYIPNHNGVETLQIRQDHIWIRSYTTSQNQKTLDSGSWTFDSLDGYRLELVNFSYRHRPWIDGVYKYDKSSQLGDTLPRSGIWSNRAYKKASSIRILIPDDYPTLFYEKLYFK